MTSLPALLVGGTLSAALIFAYVVDLVQVPVSLHLGAAQRPCRGPPRMLASVQTQSLPRG
jgi:hypothetical protein